jgi:hypothetical protein
MQLKANNLPVTKRLAASAFMVWAMAGLAASKTSKATRRAIIDPPIPLPPNALCLPAINHANQAQACPSFIEKS